MPFLVSAPRSIVPGLDCRPDRGAEIVRGVQGVEAVHAFKLGCWKGTLRSGLDAYVQAVGPYLNGRKLIYDHQKAGTDIPDLEDALPDLVEAGVHAAIFFPFGGAETLERWTRSAVDAGLSVIVGGHMTQKRFLWSEGGFIHDEAPERIYRLAVQLGVREFVVPGNKPEFVEKYKRVPKERNLICTLLVSSNKAATSVRPAESLVVGGMPLLLAFWSTPLMLKQRLLNWQAR